MKTVYEHIYTMNIQYNYKEAGNLRGEVGHLRGEVGHLREKWDT